VRALLTGEFALAVAGETDTYIKLEIQNGSGTWVDVGAALGTHWIVNATWGEHIDTPVSQATFTLVQEIGGVSLAPLMATSVLNVDDSSVYAPLLDIARLVRASSATMPKGVALDVSKYREIFTGRIDDVNTPDSQEMMGPITIQCSDLGGWLMDLQIETEGTEYGTTPVGTALQTVLQAVINDNIPAGDPAVTVVKASSSGYAVTEWAQGETKVMDALQTIVLDSTGEDIRYRYDANHVSQLTWFDPNRSRVTVDGTIGTDQYVARTLSLSLADVRNAIEMPYSDPAGPSGTVLSEDLPSISKNRRRYNRIGASAMIGTEAEAQAVVDAVSNDLSDAPAEMSADCHYLWFVQLYDRYTFTANHRQFTDDQTLAVSGYQHTVTNGQAVTALTLSGRVVGAYAQWVRRLAPGSAVERSLNIVRINSVESADGLTRNFTVLVGTRVETLFVHYRTVAITETEDWYDFSDTAVLAVDGGSPLVKTPALRVVTFSLTQPTRGYAMALRLVPVAAGNLQGASALVTIDAAPPGINATIHATKVANLARLSIDIAFGPSDGPVSVAVIERVLGVPTTILTKAMAASATIDWTTDIELDARAIPANADSISWTVRITDISGNVVTFGPTYALASAVLITATPVESAGSATVTVVVTDAGAYLDKTHVDGAITGAMSWHLTRLGVTSVVACTSVPGGGATSGTYTQVQTLDPLHPIQVAGFVHYVDGDTECFGVWTFDSDKIADVVNASVGNTPTTATVTVICDSDALIGANCARYNVDGGAWVSTVTISGAYLSQFDVARTGAKQTVTFQAKNAVDAGATWGNITTLEISATEVGTVYSECKAIVTTVSATQITVTVSAAVVSGTPTVGYVGLTGATTLASGHAAGTYTYAINGTDNVWVFDRGAIGSGGGQAQFRAITSGTQSDDDFVQIPEIGRDTVALAMRARVTASTATTATVRVAVADPYPQGANSATITYTETGGTGTACSPASGGTVTPAATIADVISPANYIDYTVTRPAFRTGTRRVTFTATAAGRVSDSDAVDVPAAEATAAPVLTITIGNNNSSSDLTALVSAIVSAPTNAASIKWLASTSSQPSAASTASSGTAVSSGAPVFVIASLSVSLNLGDTVYLTVVYYDALGTLMDGSVQGRATRASLSRSKTAIFAGNRMGVAAFAAGAIVTDASTGAVSLKGTVDGGPAVLTSDFMLAEGGTITGVSCDVWQEVYAGDPSPSFVRVLFYANGSTVASLTSTATAAAWVTRSASCSQTTTAALLTIGVELAEAYSFLDDKEKVRTFSVTYLPSSLQATL